MIAILALLYLTFGVGVFGEIMLTYRQPRYNTPAHLVLIVFVVIVLGWPVVWLYEQTLDMLPKEPKKIDMLKVHLVACRYARVNEAYYNTVLTNYGWDVKPNGRYESMWAEIARRMGGSVTFAIPEIVKLGVTFNTVELQAVPLGFTMIASNELVKEIKNEAN